MKINRKWRGFLVFIFFLAIASPAYGDEKSKKWCEEENPGDSAAAEQCYLFQALAYKEAYEKYVKPYVIDNKEDTSERRLVLFCMDTFKISEGLWNWMAVLVCCEAEFKTREGVK